MYNRVAAAALAARVRSLLGIRDRAAVRLAAGELGVADGDLWEIVEHETRYPAPTVLAAIVVFYGVDPRWLITGEYSPASHRALAEADESPSAAVARLLHNEAEST